MRKKELAARISAIIIAESMLIGQTLPAFAGPEIPEEAIVMQNPDALQMDSEAEVVDGSEVVPEEESEEVQIPEEVQTPDAEAVPEAVPGDGEKEQALPSVEESTETEVRTSEEPVFTVKDSAENELNYEISWSGSIKANQKLMVAVWSADQGQNDLVWYTLTEKNSLYTVNVRPADHKSTGLYYAHLYLRDEKGIMNFLAKDTFTVHEVTAEGIEVTEKKDEKGTAVITITGVSCPSGVKKVQFPVWSKKDQSDICWYEATMVEEGTWQATMDLSRHNYNYGDYTIHAYATSGNGVRNYLAKSAVTFVKGEVLLTADPSGDGYTIKAANLLTEGIKEAAIAIWSAKDGQDDLKWVNTPVKANGSVSIAWAPKEYGDYYIHMYLRTKDGKMVFQKALTVNVKGPSAESMTISTDAKKGSFTITVQGVSSPKPLKEILIPVWSDPKQSDIVWYTAAKQADGSYRVTSDISRHAYNLGTYKAHVYANDTTGQKTFLIHDSFTIEGSVGDLTAVLSEQGDSCRISVDQLSYPGVYTKAAFAVWSAENGQDDLVWYTVPVEAGAASVDVPIANHKTAGSYYVHLYLSTASGKKVYVNKTDFTIDAAAKAEVAFSDRDEKNATFKTTVTLSDVKGSLKGLKAAVWCKGETTDLSWYTAEEDADGSWSFTVDAKNHKANFGTYHVAVYPVFAGDVQLAAGEGSYEFSVKDYLTVVNAGTGVRQAILRNPSKTYQTVQFPTWSNTSGQDDIVWYNATKQSDGSWIAEIRSSNHKHSGDYTIHCYADNSYVGALSCSFAESEMRSIGDKKIDEYVQKILAVTGRDLRQVYLWCVRNINYEHMAIPMAYPAGYTRQQYYMVYAYEHRTGNCFCYAATFYYCAKALGYDARLIEGRYLRSDRTHGEHGWVEIWINGTAYVCDPEIAWQSMLYDTYMRPYGSTTLTYFRNEKAY